MVDTIDMVDKLLADLKNIGGVEASIAASRDGLLIRGNMPKEKLLASLAAMSATMLGAAETATTQVEKGLPARVIVESEYGRLIIVGAGPKALLIILANLNSSLGLILIELDKSAKTLKELLK
ncbi:MAG: roadblock/LC7 domain-containing protein [Candidatus Methanoperedens sp.]|jgi:predicted regulator of Ras-like GTPase activity (Roadblock/LC7/MglB family)|nr:roadblock/LC7 domain-containing protein [Candidatus Methanoperedens sp.]